MAQLSFASAAPRPSLVRTARLVRAVPTVASAMSIDEIIPNLFLGDLIAAKSPELLSSLGITHVLSLISEDFGFRGEAFGILHKQFLVQDARSQNLLAYLIEGVEWIENAFLGVHPVIEPTKPARAPSNNKPRQLADDNYKLATQMKDGTVSVYENDASTTKDQGEQAPAGSSPDAAMDTIMDFSEDSTTTITIETPASSDEKQPSNEALMRAMVLNREVKVFVHCRMGISRSCSVIIAYVMKHHNLSPPAALALVRTRRPRVNPNPAFRVQLELLHETGFDISHLGDEILACNIHNPYDPYEHERGRDRRAREARERSEQIRQRGYVELRLRKDSRHTLANILRDLETRGVLPPVVPTAMPTGAWEDEI